MKYFSFTQDEGIAFHETEDAARKAAASSLETYRDVAADDGWPEDTTDICYGKILGAVEQTSRTERPDNLTDEGEDEGGTFWQEHWDHMATYELKPVSQDDPKTLEEEK